LEEPKVVKKVIPGTDISDIDSTDEIGAPKAIWLINVQRELKKKSVVELQKFS
jgi:hypothetical protein